MTIRRRDNPPLFSDYTRYKSVLREDFRFCCAYCNTHESVFGALRNMTIDHYRPRSKFPRLVTAYGNLYYCCGECNTYKGDRWPTYDESKDGFRFLDACTDEWSEHLRYQQCEAVVLTNPARYTVGHLRLNRPAIVGRRRDLASRFNNVVGELRRLEDIRKRTSEGIGAPMDPSLVAEFATLRESLIADLRQIIFPGPLEEN